MSRIAKINNAYQKGRQKAANVYGQSYNIYRLGITSTGSIISPNNEVLSDFPASISRYTARVDIENTMFELLIFNCVTDGRQIQLGDVMVEDPTTLVPGDGSAYIIGSMRPLHNILAVRAESLATLSRPTSTAGSFENQPVSGSIAVDSYAGPGIFDKQICTLTGGTYSFQTEGTSAVIPCGLQPQSRKGQDHEVALMPSQVPDSYLAAFLPLLPGVEVLETDVISIPNQVDGTDDYEVIQVFTTDTIGFAGYVLHVTKMLV